MKRIVGIALILSLAMGSQTASLHAGTLDELKGFAQQERTWKSRTEGQKRLVAVRQAGGTFRDRIQSITRAEDEGIRRQLAEALAEDIVAADAFTYNVTLDVISEEMTASETGALRLATLTDAVIAEWQDSSAWRKTKKVLVVGGITIGCAVVGGAVATKIANHVLHGTGTGGIGKALMMLVGGVVVADVVVGIPLAKFYFYKAFRRSPELVLKPELTRSLIRTAELSGATIDLQDLQLAESADDQPGNEDLNLR